jgi:hypothetical protein
MVIKHDSPMLSIRFTSNFYAVVTSGHSSHVSDISRQSAISSGNFTSLGQTPGTANILRENT